MNSLKGCYIQLAHRWDSLGLYPLPATLLVLPSLLPLDYSYYYAISEKWVPFTVWWISSMSVRHSSLETSHTSFQTSIVCWIPLIGPMNGFSPGLILSPQPLIALLTIEGEFIHSRATGIEVINMDTLLMHWWFAHSVVRSTTFNFYKATTMIKGVSTSPRSGNSLKFWSSTGLLTTATHHRLVVPDDSRPSPWNHQQ